MCKPGGFHRGVLVVVIRGCQAASLGNRIPSLRIILLGHLDPRRLQHYVPFEKLGNINPVMQRYFREKLFRFW